jgi:hypothetical protein
MRIAEAHPTLKEGDPAIARHYAWQLFHRGRIKEAAAVAAELCRTASGRDLNLEVAIALETGDWEALPNPLAAFADRRRTAGFVALWIFPARTALSTVWIKGPIIAPSGMVGAFAHHWWRRRWAIDPKDIDAVVMTHAHIDHLGGNNQHDGTSNFPNAQFYITQADFDFWTDESKPKNEKSESWS